MADRKDQMIRLGGLWVNQTRGGDEYLAGNLGQARVLIFPNTYAKSDKDPSHVMYLAPQSEREAGLSSSGGSGDQPKERSRSRGGRFQSCSSEDGSITEGDAPF